MICERATRISRCHDSGFTLVELLVALALMGLLSVLLLSGARTGFVTWQAITQRGDRLDQITLVQAQLRRLIAGAYPMYVASEATPGHVAFEGSPTSLRFLSKAPMAVQDAGRAVFDLSIEPRDGRFTLTLMSQPELTSRPHHEPPAAITLINSLESMSFAYFGRLSRDGAPAWHDRWQAQPELPLLVRIDARFAAGNARRWPVFIVRPQIDVDVACVHDPLSKQCRGR